MYDGSVSLTTETLWQIAYRIPMIADAPATV